MKRTAGADASKPNKAKPEAKSSAAPDAWQKHVAGCSTFAKMTWLSDFERRGCWTQYEALLQKPVAEGAKALQKPVAEGAKVLPKAQGAKVLQKPVAEGAKENPKDKEKLKHKEKEKDKGKEKESDRAC